MAPARMMSARSALSPRIFARPRRDSAFQPLANGGDVRLVQPQPVPMLALARVGAQVDAGQRADGAAETDHDLAAPGGRHDARASRRGPRSRSACSSRGVGGSWRRNRRVVRTGAERKARDGDHPAAPHPAELQARAAEVRDDAVLDRAGSRGRPRRPAAPRPARSGPARRCPPRGAGVPGAARGCGRPARPRSPPRRCADPGPSDE